MKYVFYYIPLALIFLGIMSCKDSKSLMKEDTKPFDYNKDSKPPIKVDTKPFDYKTSEWRLKKPILYKGTPVYEAAQAIADKDNNALRAWATKASDELLNFQNAQQANMPLNLYAFKRGNIEAVKILTEAGADPNLQSDGNYSVFLLSCGLRSYKDNSMLIYLLANGGNPNAESSKAIYRTPLIGISMTNLENVKILEKGGANINYIWKYSDGTIDSPLLVALRFKKIHIVNYFILEKGIDFRSIDKPSIRSGIPPRTILTYLRKMPFLPGSEHHKAKWKLIKFLKEQGLDYKKQPIPKNIQKAYDKEFLDAY